MYLGGGRWRRFWPAAWAGALAAAVTLVTAGAAAAPSQAASSEAGAWTISGVPAVQLANGRLAGEACSAAGACVAVGSSYGPGGASRTLAEGWNGTAWVVQPSPDPRGARGSLLEGVSCPAASACTAVGSFMNGSRTAVPLAEAWDGTTWSIQPVPVPAGSYGAQLTGVSCPAANACVAVGYYEDQNWEENPVAFAAAWDGSAWASLPPPLPGALESSLKAVSCSGPGACVATGTYVGTTGSQQPLAVSWDGTVWTQQSAPVPAGRVYSSSLNGVSCAAANACTAVGSYAPYGRHYRERTLAEAWNGSAWTIQPTPSPSAANQLTAVWCTAATVCTAVGWQSQATSTLPLAEAWDGSAWTTQAASGRPGALGNALAGVACAAGSCSAVGSVSLSPADYPYGVTQALALARSGTRWAPVPAPGADGAPGSSLGAVSCPAAAVCAAVGTEAAVRDGARWRLLPLVPPRGTVGVELTGVSCSTPAACTAVGFSVSRAFTEQALAGTWDGTRWRLRPAAIPAGAASSSLAAVSCTAASACTAVGSYHDGSGNQKTLAEAWDGTSWTIEPTVDPGGARYITLTGVSCVAASACVAVGSYQKIGYGYPYRPLAETWNGTAWSEQPMPGPSGSSVNAVSCGSAGSCAAAGYAGANPVIWSWNGTAWSDQRLPVPPGSFEAFLGDVSCAAASACTAVGFADQYNTGYDVALAETWNGTAWSREPVPTPRGVTLAGLSGVSCRGADTCTAVGTRGQHLPAFGTDVPFAEQRH